MNGQQLFQAFLQGRMSKARLVKLARNDPALQAEMVDAAVVHYCKRADQFADMLGWDPVQI